MSFIRLHKSRDSKYVIDPVKIWYSIKLSDYYNLLLCKSILNTVQLAPVYFYRNTRISQLYSKRTFYVVRVRYTIEPRVGVLLNERLVSSWLWPWLNHHRRVWLLGTILLVGTHHYPKCTATILRRIILTVGIWYMYAI